MLEYPFLQPPTADDEIGRLGNYRILRLLGAGGMGMVFLAEDAMLGRSIALKVMKPDPGTSEPSDQRFLREARTMAAIKHDHLVTIYQVGQEGNTLYIAMELLVGESLEDRINRTAEWDLHELLRIGIELASGLAAIHEHGLIHRDIKPANIWLEEPHARVKILDFGLVRAAKEDLALTNTGIIIGTPAFLAPEQARGKMADARSDIYSFGCILYRLCTGQYPLRSDNALAQLAALVADDPEPIRQLNPGIPQELSDLVMQTLAKQPEVRPQSARELADRLAQMLRPKKKKKHRDPDTALIEIPPEKSSRRSRQIAKKPKFLEKTWVKILGYLLAAVAVMVFGTLAGVGAVLWWNKGLDQKDGQKQLAKELPPGEKLFLADMKEVDAVNWPFDGFKKDDKKKDDKKFPPDFFKRVVVKGVQYPRGIFMHPDPKGNIASVTYNLDQKYKSFTTKVSINDTARIGARSPMTFWVYGDNVKLWESKPVVTNEQTQEVTLSVEKVKLLKLEVTVPGDIGGAHGVWIDPQLTRKEK